jgi:tetratricopeptide (TPR) repeat protein
MKKTIIFALLMPVLILVCADLYAAGARGSMAALYNRGNRLYEEGKYPDAADVYGQLVSSGAVNGYLFYNLGNTYFKEGNIGNAVLWYARARRILPRDGDVATNLELARNVRADKIEAARLPLVIRLLQSFLFGLNLSELSLLSFILYLLVVLSLILFLLTRVPVIRRFTGISSLAVGVLLALSLLWLAGRVYQANRTVECVIMSPQVDAMSGPGTEYTKVMSLHEGAEAQVEEEREGWLLIKLGSGIGGWIPRQSAEKI